MIMKFNRDQESTAISYLLNYINNDSTHKLIVVAPAFRMAKIVFEKLLNIVPQIKNCRDIDKCSINNIEFRGVGDGSKIRASRCKSIVFLDFEHTDKNVYQDILNAMSLSYNI